MSVHGAGYAFPGCPRAPRALDTLYARFAYDTAKTPSALHAKHVASGHYIQLDQPHIVIRAILSGMQRDLKRR